MTAVAQQRRQQRPGEAEHEQQRGDVADQQVLGHVGHEQLVGERVDRRAERDREHDQAGDVARLAPGRHRPAARSASVRARTPVRAATQSSDQDRQADRLGPGASAAGRRRAALDLWCHAELGQRRPSA